MILNLAKKNRSYRVFDNKVDICKDLLIDLISITRYCPSSTNKQPYKFFMSWTKETNDKIFPYLKWAALLKDWHGPKKEEAPKGYIIILGDKNISEAPAVIDIGIIAQTILLYAAELDINGCMIGSADKEKIKQELGIADRYNIALIIALGRGNEKIVIEDSKDGNTNYYRDENNCHHVPKRTLDEIIINK